MSPSGISKRKSSRRRSVVVDKKDRTSPCRASDQPTDTVVTFPYFQKLPVEIQLMIWEYWRLDQPRLRHYCSLQDQGRLYAAYDTTAQEFVKTISRSADIEDDAPLDPLEFKIRFRGQIKTIVNATNVMLALQPKMSTNKAPLCPAYAWVNFAKDVFYVTNNGYKRVGQLRFFHNGIGAMKPQELEDDHWAKRIQHLALEAPVNDDQLRLVKRIYTNNAYSQREILTDVDCQDLKRLTCLKTIYVVMRVFIGRWPLRWGAPRCPVFESLTNLQEDAFGFWDYEKVAELHACRDKDAPYYRCPEVKAGQAMASMKEQLEKLFEGKNSVQIKTVAVGIRWRDPVGVWAPAS